MRDYAHAVELMGGEKKSGGPLSGALESLLSDLKKNREQPLNKLQADWVSLAGEKIAAHTKPGEVREGVLLIKVDTASWAQEISIRYKQIIIKRIQGKLGEDFVRDIKLSIGEI